MGKATFSMKDESNEVNGFGVFIPDLDSGNIGNYNSVAATAINAIITGLNTICNSNFRGVSVSAFSTIVSEDLPGDAEAQNEKRLLLKYQDTVEPSIKGRIEVPGFDVASYLTSGTDVIDMNNVDIASFIGVLETHCVSKLGNPISFYEAVFVGRNS